LKGAALILAGALLAAGCGKPADKKGPSKPAGGAKPDLKTPSLAVNLPIEHNTPDGMVLAENGDIFLSCPNFNTNAEENKHPACIMIITPEDKLEKFFELPVHPETKRACPLGIDLGSDGNLYIADAQALGGAETAISRLLKLTIEEGKPVKCESVVEGFGFSNAVACYGDDVYVTETMFKPNPETSPIDSGVYRFKISELDGEKPIMLEADGKDPHLLVKLSTKNEAWKVGANGLGFAADGTMYIGNFGDAQLIEVKLDKDGKVASQKVVAEGDPMKCVDGLKVDQKTGLVYLADFLANAVHMVDPKTGKITMLAQNDLSDGKDGALDKCSEVCLRGNKVYVSNIDLGMDGNTFDEPYTISVIELDKE